MKTAIAIPLKKSRKKKTNVFLRGSCFRYPFSAPFASLEAAPPLLPKVPSVFPPPSLSCGTPSPRKAFSMGHSLRSWHPAKAKGCFAPGPFSGINPAIHPMVFPRFSPLLFAHSITPFSLSWENATILWHNFFPQKPFISPFPCISVDRKAQNIVKCKGQQQ